MEISDTADTVAVPPLTAIMEVVTRERALKEGLIGTWWRGVVEAPLVPVEKGTNLYGDFVWGGQGRRLRDSAESPPVWADLETPK